MRKTLRGSRSMLQTVKFYLIAVLWLVLPPEVMRAADENFPPVPLVEDGNMIQVPVAAFHKTLYFIVDTGFTISAIDTKYAAYLGDPIASYPAISPLGTRKNVPIYQCPEISLAGRPLALEKIAGLDLQMLSSIAGRPCDGILGLDWFAQNVVSINFDRQTFSVEPATPEIVRNTFVPVPLEPANGYYTMPVRLNGGQVFNLMIDTGDSSSLSLNEDDWGELFSTNQTKTVRATVADAVNQVAQTEIGVLGRLTIQSLNYTNLHAMRIHCAGQPSRLGLGFFKRHDITFDVGGGMLYLQPGQKYAAADIEDMSGLHLLREGGRTTVYSVDENSPASAQGILPRDIIDKVNGQSASALTMDAIRQILRSGDRVQIALELRRGDNLRDIRIILKKSI